MTELERLRQEVNYHVGKMQEYARGIRITHDAKEMLRLSSLMKEHSHLMKESNTLYCNELRKVRRDSALDRQIQHATEIHDIKIAYAELEQKYYDLVTYVAERNL